MRPARARLATAGVLAGVQLLAVLDGLAAALALPELGRDLDLGPAGKAWVLNATSVALAGGLLVAGRLGDLLGRRRLFLWGTTLLATGSVVCGAAAHASVMLGGRAVVGLGAALAYPSALALLSDLFPDEPWRTRAFATSAVAGASGTLGGAVYGGLVTGLLGWRWVFWLTVPLTVGLWWGARALLPRGHDRRAGDRPLDVPGGALATLAVSGLVAGVIGLGTSSLDLAPAVAVLAGSAGTAALLVRHERRTRDPLLPRRVVRSRRLLGGCAGMAANSALWSVVVFGLSQHLQAEGWSPERAGLALLPASAGIVLAGLVAVPRLRRRFGSVRTAAGGLTAGTCSTALLAPATGLPYALAVAPALLVLGMALSATHTGLMEHTLRDGPAGAEGVSAAVFESSTHVGGAVAVAVFAASIATAGFTPVYLVAAAFGGAGCAGVVVLLRAAPSRPEGAGEAATPGSGHPGEPSPGAV